jgi:parallel beta-helix repeat protein
MCVSTGIVAVALAVCTSAFAQNLNVDGRLLTVDINDPRADLPGDDLYAQIHQAVAAASPGTRIVVHGGTYEPVEISTDDLSIVAATASSVPIVDATGVAVAVSIDADRVTIGGLEARNARGRSHQEFGFFVSGNANALIGNVAANNTHGFAIDAGTGNHLIGNAAHGNGTGVEVFASFGNTFIGNRACGNDGAGIIEARCGANTWIGNVADDNAWGFDLFEAERSVYAGNRADGNTREGFRIQACRDAVFVTNRANGNARDGFQLWFTDGCVFAGNRGDGNGRDGFSLNDWQGIGSTGNRFWVNRAWANVEWGIYGEPLSWANWFFATSARRNGLGRSNIPGV